MADKKEVEERLVRALEQIAEASGPYSRDRLHMVGIAERALAATKDRA